MFRCEITGKLSKLGEKVNRIVVEKREKVYYAMQLNEDTEQYEKVEVGRGWEIVKEVNASSAGLELWNKTKNSLQE